MNETVENEITEKWHKILWWVCFITSIIVFVVECLFFMINNNKGRIASSDGYILNYIMVPTLIDLVVLGASSYLFRQAKLSINVRNWVAAFLIYIIMAKTPFVHYKLLSLALLPAVAIVATSIFANYQMTVTISLLSIVSVIINTIRSQTFYKLDLVQHYSNLAFAIILMIAVCIITIVVTLHTKALLHSISGSYSKQQLLINEMKKDPLTGLYNRRSFEETIEAEIRRVEENEEKAYIAIFDIDHFKNVNDTYGHSNGDVVIKALCKMLKEKSKEYGLAFRYGGEEFVVLFNNIELPKVINVVEDIRTEFRCYYFQFMKKDGITVSCGIAEYIKGEDPKSWFNRADNSLYQAKEAGRNRTVVSE